MKSHTITTVRTPNDDTQVRRPRPCDDEDITYHNDQIVPYTHDHLPIVHVLDDPMHTLRSTRVDSTFGPRVHTVRCVHQNHEIRIQEHVDLVPSNCVCVTIIDFDSMLITCTVGRAPDRVVTSPIRGTVHCALHALTF
jgi:hypothetical protein